MKENLRIDNIDPKLMRLQLAYTSRQFARTKREDPQKEIRTFYGIHDIEIDGSDCYLNTDIDFEKDGMTPKKRTKHYSPEHPITVETLAKCAKEAGMTHLSQIKNIYIDSKSQRVCKIERTGNALIFCIQD